MAYPLSVCEHDCIAPPRKLLLDNLKIVSYHKPPFKVANRVIFTDGGEFLEDGTPEQIFDNPQHPRLKDFLDKVLNV